MAFLAKIDGTYKSKVYINLIFFKIVRGWRTEAFSWSQRVESPELHLAWAPIRNLPLAISLDVTPLGADFGLQVLSENFPIEHVAFTGASEAFHWEPLKGVIVDGVASFAQAT